MAKSITFVRGWALVWLAGLGWLGALALAASSSHACPFCGPTAQTFAEEMETMDVVAMVKLVHIPPLDPNNSDLAKAKFEVIDLIKNGSGTRAEDTKGSKQEPLAVKVGDKIETIYFGDGKVGSVFLIMGIGPTHISWSTPLMLTPRAQAYLKKIPTLPKDGNERYTFFQQYLEDEDETLARDAYDEFAKASYSQVKEMRPHMNHDQLVKWIQDTDIPASRRRLYLVMLGVCGSEDDLPMLASAMKSTDRKAKAGLDALIACYLTLKGETGMELVEELYLKNKKADYADTYSAIMALRFHGTEGGVIKRERVVEGLRHMLKRPELADLVIPDLATWENWSAADELFDLFKNADEKSTWVRVPVINYLRRCPHEHAKELLKECEKIDPASVKRANTFFPGDAAPSVPDPKKATKTTIPARAAKPAEQVAAAPLPPEDEQEVATAEGRDETAAIVNKGVEPAKAILKNPLPTPNRWYLVGVPWVIGVALFVVQWWVLRGV